MKKTTELTIAEEIKKAYPQQHVFEVTIKRVYATENEIDKDLLEKEWFGTHMNQFHAYRDGSRIGGADQLVNVKEIKLPKLPTE